MNMMLVLAIYVVAIVAYVAFSRRRQAKAQEDRFAGLAKGAEVETIGGLIAIVDEIDKENNINQHYRISYFLLPDPLLPIL